MKTFNSSIAASLFAHQASFTGVLASSYAAAFNLDNIASYATLSTFKAGVLVAIEHDIPVMEAA